MKYERSEPYIGDAAEAFVKELAGACFPNDVTVSLSADSCSVWLLFRFGGQVPQEHRSQGALQRRSAGIRKGPSDLEDAALARL